MLPVSAFQICVMWVVQPTTLSLPTGVEFALGCDNYCAHKDMLSVAIFELKMNQGLLHPSTIQLVIVQTRDRQGADN